MTASSSASWSRFSLSSNFVNGHVWTMWFKVTCRLTAKNRDQLRHPMRSVIEYGLPLPFLLGSCWTHPAQLYDEQLLLVQFEELVGTEHAQLFSSCTLSSSPAQPPFRRNKLHCVCHKSSDAGRQMIECDGCGNWLHTPKCVLEPASPRSTARMRWMGPCCRVPSRTKSQQVQTLCNCKSRYVLGIQTSLALLCLVVIAETY